MKRVIVLVCGLFLVSCTKLGDEKVWDNPFDEQGENFKRPVVLPMHDSTVSIMDSVVMHVDVKKGNAPVERYFWSFDGGNNWTEGNNKGMYVRYFSETDTGKHWVWIKVVDSLKIESKTDSFTIEVKEFPPELKPVKDDTVSVTDTVVVSVEAADSNKTRYIQKFLWDLGADGWDDSTDEGVYVITWPSGGPLTVIWGVLDDDHQIATDTFTITFNRPPSSLNMVNPVNNGTASFVTYDKVTGKGVVRVHFSAKDPDGAGDTLTYTLYHGDAPDDLDSLYEGKDTSVEITGIVPEKAYYWRLRVKDIYGDTAVETGMYTSAEVDLTPPEITLNGPNPLKISLGVEFVDPGATAIDNADGDISDSIETSGNVNTMVADSYTITYTVEDAMENEATEKRTVIVEEYILLEDFETGPSYQTAFGALFNSGMTDSTGYWRAWTDTISTEWDPDPDSSDSAFEYIVVPGEGVEGSAGFHALVRVYHPNWDGIFWGTGFYLKGSDTYYDISEMDSITFYAKKGRNGDDIIDSARFDVSYYGIDWGYAGVNICLTHEWKKYVLKPEDFSGVPDSPGENHTWDDAKRKVKMFRFVNHPDILGDIDLYVDNIQLHGNFSNHELLQQ